MTGSKRSAMILASVILAVTFGAGVFVGGNLRRPMPESRAGAPMPVPLEMGVVMDQLDLNEEQTERVNSLLNRWSDETDSAMSQIGGRISAIADSLNAEIRNILTNPQLVLYDSLIVAARSRVRLRRPRPANPR